HIDLYRVENLDLETAGEISEYMWDEDAIKIVEWAEHLPDELIPTGAIRIKLTRKSENQRTITVEREK
ncbi:MAG TPA: tRNA (adenosine(37)-N6)-threonylcarbamoyltransferase complex ATPase subunit type 1 TsaE, partial [candidate division Zixibacteria bacterium]|nr:tRNA (adenosine(37)-N6)-threonylcarbamoyltransferase complex ATPase subunit type 1 TsaE [candidate division Zixibacteria bacterium]